MMASSLLLGSPLGDFDLNTETVLEAWSVSHAVRELIANALDEMTLFQAQARGSLKRAREVVHTGESIQVTRVPDRPKCWVIRDFGRGIRHTHLTQNESTEKLAESSEGVIGRFGFGLKDSLAVLHRLGVGVQMTSAHLKATLVMSPKAGFSDVTTLHARITESPAKGMLGTEILLDNVDDIDMETAKRFFLCFNDDVAVDTTQFGQVLRKPDVSSPARIYIHGMFVSEEPHFAFSYNITSLTAPMRKALNRERTNVGRVAYSSRVQDILVAATAHEVRAQLIDDLENIGGGLGRVCHEELKCWIRVKQHACELRVAASMEEGSRSKPAVYVTEKQLLENKSLVDQAQRSGNAVVVVPQELADKLKAATTATGAPMPVLSVFAEQFSSSIVDEFVPETELTSAEQAVFQTWPQLAEMTGGLPRNVKEVLISETIAPQGSDFSPVGLWSAYQQRIVIQRIQLRKLSAFAGTFLHELTHARSGYSDVSRDFESSLTNVIGVLAGQLLRASGSGGGGSSSGGISNEPRGPAGGVSATHAVAPSSAYPPASSESQERATR